MSRRFDTPNGGIQLIPPQNQPPQIVVNGGPLMNDIQLVAMVAANCIGQPVDQVDRAIEIVAHTLLKVNGSQLTRRVTALAAEEEQKRMKELANSAGDDVTCDN